MSRGSFIRKNPWIFRSSLGLCKHTHTHTHKTCTHTHTRMYTQTHTRTGMLACAIYLLALIAEWASPLQTAQWETPNYETEAVIKMQGVRYTPSGMRRVRKHGAHFSPSFIHLFIHNASAGRKGRMNLEHEWMIHIQPTLDQRLELWIQLLNDSIRLRLLTNQQCCDGKQGMNKCLLFSHSADALTRRTLRWMTHVTQEQWQG